MGFDNRHDKSHSQELLSFVYSHIEKVKHCCRTRVSGSVCHTPAMVTTGLTGLGGTLSSSSCSLLLKGC